MNLIAIDPGPARSAWVHMQGDDILDKGIDDNDRLLEVLRHSHGFPDDAQLVVEMIASMGMAVGQSVFSTCVWIGRFIEAWGRPVELIYRHQVKMTICHHPRAKDANIRQALIDRFGEPGTKKQPGKLYGVTKDVWAALAVAVTYRELQTGELQRSYA